MQYKPGSKYKVSNAVEGEFVYKSGKRPYIGPYLEMSNGTFFEGEVKTFTTLKIMDFFISLS